MSYSLKTDAKSYYRRSRPKTKVEKEKPDFPSSTDSYEEKILTLEKEINEWKASDEVKEKLKELANRMPVTALLNRYPINKGLIYNGEYEEEEDIHVHIGDYMEKDKRHPKGLYMVSWLYHYLAKEGKMVPSDISDRAMYQKNDYHVFWFYNQTDKWINYQKELEQIAEDEWDFTGTDMPKWDWIYHRIREYIKNYIYKVNQISVLKGLCLMPRTYEEAHEYNITMFDSEDMSTDYKCYGPRRLQFILDENWLDGYYDDIE